MSTIKELAETCGVSEQAIRKWCARNQVSKDIAKHYIIDRATETAILRHYGKDEGNQVAKPTTTSCETNETMKEIIEMLRKDLEAKDKQIESLQNSLDRTTAALVSAQESIKAAQLLQANSEQKLKMIEKPAEEAERPRRKHWWQRWGYSQRSAAPDLKHNERGAGRKKALSEDQIAEFEELLRQGAGEKQLRERFGISRSSYFLYKKRLAEKQ